jgi:GT2 family glycosyltransferase
VSSGVYGGQVEVTGQLKPACGVVRHARLSAVDIGLDKDRCAFVSADQRADVTVLMVTYNSSSDVGSLIDDLRTVARDHSVRVVVVDNQSSDGTIEQIRLHSDITLVEVGGNLGYAGGINSGLPFVGQCDAVLILNPDLRLAPDAVTRMLNATDGDRIGAVVPLMLDDDGATYPSLRREPSLTRAIGDAFLGGRLRARPCFLSEIDYRPEHYRDAHDVDWATGAALLVCAAVLREVGNWTEEFFLYSEETDYFRRIRDCGHRIRFEPSAVVKHRRGGSGSSPALITLMAVNRIRYVERHHGRVYSVLFRAVVALAAALRSYDAVHRRALGMILNRQRWPELPHATKPPPRQQVLCKTERGAVIIPAYNEAAVIKRTLVPLTQAALDGFIELIVVCNGCTDHTAEVARSVPGVRVVELEKGSKPAALNVGDEVASLWPRLYLDADIQISAKAVLAVLDRLTEGNVLAARPDFRYDFDGATTLVRSYYRARQRIPQHKLAMWGAGAYGLSLKGRQRFGAFPSVMGDDLYVDAQFGADEKTVVATEPAVVKTPSDTKSLLAILRRGYRGGRELSADEIGSRAPIRKTGLDTAVAVIRSIRGPRTAVDAGVYLAMAVAARRGASKPQFWERDDSSRSSM